MSAKQLGEATEDQCTVCRRWPSALRQPMRSAINSIPLWEPVCAECVKTFWANVDRQASAKRERPS